MVRFILIVTIYALLVHHCTQKGHNGNSTQDGTFIDKRVDSAKWYIYLRNFDLRCLTANRDCNPDTNIFLLSYPLEVSRKSDYQFGNKVIQLYSMTYKVRDSCNCIDVVDERGKYTHGIVAVGFEDSSNTVRYESRTESVRENEIKIYENNKPSPSRDSLWISYKNFISQRENKLKVFIEKDKRNVNSWLLTEAKRRRLIN